MSSNDIRNARDPEQIRRMKALQEKDLCYFCKQGSEEEKTLPVTIKEGAYWYVMANDFPLEGSIHHYLIVPRRHIANTFDLMTYERHEQVALEEWLLKTFLPDVTGYSSFVRSGDTKVTGATLTHLHYHYLVGGPRPKGEIKMESETVVPVVLAFKVR